jgi:hypothetical protein
VFPYFLHDEDATKDADKFNKLYLEGQDFLESLDKKMSTKIDYQRHRYLSLYFIRKTFDNNNQPTIDVKRQEDAAIEAAKYQNKEINSIISQAATLPPSIKDIIFSLFGIKPK